MKKIRLNSFFTLLLGTAIVVSCSTLETDLYVDNLEAPNDGILASDPVALEASAEGLFRSFYGTVHDYSGPALALSVMSDVNSCSWGNAGMRDLSEEPRIPFNNTSGYGNDVTRTYFNSVYSTLSDANTIIFASNNGVKFSNNVALVSVAKFSQALAIGYNALVFDRVWLSDENGPVNEGVPVDHKVAMDFALTKLDEAIALAKTSSFTLPSNYFSVEMSSSKLVELMNTIGARMLSMNPRTKADKASINWNKVKSYALNGVKTDFDIVTDNINWSDLLGYYATVPSWGRIDNRVLNLLDPNHPKKWTSATVTGYPEITTADKRIETDFAYLSSQNFRPERGIYHYSNYRYARFNSYISTFTGPTPEVSVSENHLYLAEAELMLGNTAAAAAIINSGTRTTRGNLPNVSATASEIDHAIHYERMIEIPFNSLGLTFWDMRGRDLLQSGTLLHFPIPGSALESIPEPYYTYGATEGTVGKDVSGGGW